MFLLKYMWVFICIIAIICHITQSKVFTTDDAVVYEGDPPERPGPSLFDFLEGASDSTKVKRGNTNQRYYELIDDEVYVFEPSPMGMKPFMEALFPQGNQQRQNPQSRLQQHPHQKTQQFYGKYDKKNKVGIQSSNPIGSSSHYSPPPPQTHHNHPKVSFAPEVIQSATGREAEISWENTQALEECVSSNEKMGLCIPFRECYPVVFNMVDGKLRNAELAKILYHASGPCVSEKYESDFKRQHGREERNKKKNKKDSDIPTTFYNDTVCCPGYHLTRNAISLQEESKTMTPSQPDPRFSPPEFQDIPPFESQISATDSDYYIDEYDGDIEFYTTTTETPKVSPKTVLKVKSNKNTTKSTVSISTPAKSKTSERTKKNEQSTSAESNLSEVKVESSDSPKSSNEGVSSLSSSYGLKSSTRSPIVSRTEGPVPVIVAPPHLSAWNCPGREMGMPRGQWPWMVSLLSDGIHFCSGALIDHRHILSSSSCVASFKGKDIGRIRVILGDRVMYSSIDGPHLWRKVLRITRHILFNPTTMEHDIAMLEMDNPVSYSPNIQPINLPASGNRSHATKAIVSGWSGPDIGKRIFAARTTNDAIMEFMDAQECKKQYDGFVTEGIADNVICTKPSSTSCMADLGAPLMMKTGNCWHIIGILSHGLGCGTFPDIFTDTAKHMPWIQKNIRHHNILV